MPQSSHQPTPNVAGWKNHCHLLHFPATHRSQVLSRFPVLPRKGLSHPHVARDLGWANLFPEKTRTIFLVLLLGCIKPCSRIWWIKASILYLTELRYEAVLSFSFVSLAEPWNQPHSLTRSCSFHHIAKLFMKGLQMSDQGCVKSKQCRTRFKILSRSAQKDNSRQRQRLEFRLEFSYLCLHDH